MSKILVIGSLNVDMVMNVDHMPEEGETILCDVLNWVPGGKGANQAYAVGRLGGDVTMFGAVGTDDNAEMELKNLSGGGVDVSHVLKKENEPTGVAVITVNKRGNNSIVVIQGANAQFSPEDIEQNRKLIEDCDLLIMQMEIPIPTVCRAAQIAKECGKTVLLDPAPVPEYFPEELYQWVDIIKPNETELARLTGRPTEVETIAESTAILKKKGVKDVLVTLGGQGVYVEEAGKDGVVIPANKVEVVDTTAAGDTFTAALALKFLEGHTLTEAAQFANMVSSIVVTRKGAQSSIPSMEEVLEILK